MRHSYLKIIAVIAMMSCNQKPDSAKSADSTAVDSTSTTALPELPQPEVPKFSFENKAFFNKPLDYDFSDSTALAAALPGLYNENYMEVWNTGGGIYYKFFHIDQPGLKLNIYDFREEDGNMYYEQIVTSDANVKFSKGIRVGMSKVLFLEKFRLSGAEAEKAEHFDISYGDHWGQFNFVDGLLKDISLYFEYDKFPDTIEDLCNGTWQSITSTAVNDEGWIIDCGTYTYSLEFLGYTPNSQNPFSQYLLQVGLVQDSRTDSVREIMRASDGFVLVARNAFNNWEPYNVIVGFHDSTARVADWNNKTFASSYYAEELQKEECDGSEP